MPTEYAPLFRPSMAPYPIIVKNSFLVIAVVASVLMLFIGAMLVHSAPLMTNKKYSGSSAADDQAADYRTQVAVTDTGHVLSDVGAFLLMLMMLLAGLLRSDWSDTVRSGCYSSSPVFAFSLGFRL